MKTAMDYARQALRFAILSGVDADYARKTWLHWYERGVEQRSRPVIHGVARYIEESARDDTRHAASRAKMARRGEPLMGFDSKEVAIGAAKAAAFSAGLLGYEL